MELSGSTYLIIRGFIDAKDDRGRTTYASLLALVSRREIRYLSVLFTREETPKETEWHELLKLHQQKNDTPERDPMAIHNEEAMYNYLMAGTLLNGVVKNRNAKTAEQAISRFCLEQLQLKAVSFLDFSDASENDIDIFEGEKKTDNTEPQPEATSDKSAEADEIVADVIEKTNKDIFVRCEPILDPVHGVAMNELKIGDKVYGKLPGDSVFFKLLSQNHNTFDGIISAKVTGIFMNEYGTATVSLELSEGVAGIMKLSGKVRIKVPSAENLAKDVTEKGKIFSFSNLSTEMVFGLAGAVVLISALLMVYYIFM